MLKTLDPVLTPDLLWVLAAMGHGDELVLSDANFPSQSIAGSKHLIRLPGIDTARAARAILSVMPLDTFVTHPVQRMEVVGRPEYLPPVQQEMQDEIDRAEGRLERVLERWTAPLQGYRLYYPSRRFPSPAFALVVDALRHRAR